MAALDVDNTTANVARDTTSRVVAMGGYRQRVLIGSSIPVLYTDGVEVGIGLAPAPDANPPTITIISPTPGVSPGEPGGFPRRRSQAIQTPIVLRVSDADPGIAYLHIAVRFYGSPAELAADANGIEEDVYRRGAFRGKHVVGSSAVVDGSGLILTIRRAGGWIGRFFKFSVDAIDSAGNLAS